MHIIFVTSEMPTKENYRGGLATFTVNTAEIFAAKGNQVEILHVTTKEEQEEYACTVKVKNIYIDKQEWNVYDDVSKIYCTGQESEANRREMVSLMKAKAVCDYIYAIDQEQKVDIVHFSNHGAYSIFMGEKIPYVIRISGFLNVLLGGASSMNGSIRFEDNPLQVRDKLEIYAMKKANRVFAPSQLIADIGEENLNIKVDVLESPYIVNHEKWNNTIVEKKLKEKRYILFYGNLRYLKGIHVIADLVKPILGQWPDLYFVLAGIDMEIEDENKQPIMASTYVSRRAEEYAHRVLYLDKLNKSELFPVIHNAEVCLMPSRIENLSNACIEAMALQKIVIASKNASFEQLIVDGENGFLCEKDCAEAFINTINKVLSLPMDEKRKIENKAKTTISRLDPDVVYANFLKYYQAVIDDLKWR